MEHGCACGGHLEIGMSSTAHGEHTTSATCRRCGCRVTLYKGPSHPEAHSAFWWSSAQVKPMTKPTSDVVCRGVK
jgi:hypothetical protein